MGEGLGGRAECPGLCHLYRKHFVCGPESPALASCKPVFSHRFPSPSVTYHLKHLLHESARAAVTKRLGSLNDRHLFSQSGGWTSRVKVPGKGSPPGLQMAVFSACPHMTSSLCGERDSLVSPPMRTLTLLDQGPTHMTSFNPHYFLRNPISKDSHSGC